MIPTWPQRLFATACYLGALRVPLVALVLPEWAFTVPSGLLVTGAAWLYGRRRSPFLFQHARDGFRWSLQSNLLLAAIAVLARSLHWGWQAYGWAGFHSLWYASATLFRWAGLLVTLVTLVVMIRAARGQVGDALSPLPRTAGHHRGPSTV